MPGLVDLRAHLNTSRRAAPDAKLLVCVSSIGPWRTVRSQNTRTDLSLAEVRVFDETASCVLKLWQDKVASARAWIPNQTVLLITNPRLSPPGKRNTAPELGIGITSTVDVNPDFPDAHWLRKMAASRIKTETVYRSFPTSIWDVEAAAHDPDSALLTLANIDDFARDDPHANFTGKLSVLITGVNITECWRKKALCCFAW